MSNEQSGVDAPSLPEDVIEAIREYGDARSDPATAAGSTAKMGAAILAVRRWGASLAAQPAPYGVPDGWKLVPETISEEMHIAASKVLRRSNGLDGTPQRMLDAMLAAAPAAPQAEPQQPEGLREALQQIADWRLPATGEFWDNDHGRPIGYEVRYGANGARDYMRCVARAALAATAQPKESREALARRLIGDVIAAAEIATTVCRAVAELPDRNSPEDLPEAMLVTHAELHQIVEEAVIESQPVAPTQVDAGAELAKVWDAVYSRIEEYVEGYEMHGEDESGREGYYTPTKSERGLILDAMHGLFADDEFSDALRYALAAQGGQEAKPVGWQFLQDGVWHDGMRSVKNHRANTEAAGIPTRDVFAHPPRTQGDAQLYWTHKVKGGTYRDIGAARIQANVPLSDLDDVRVYAGEDGAIWVRGVPEFHQKFAQLDAAIARQGGKGGA